MTTHREELINELAYVVGKDRAERMVSEMLMEDAQKRLSEMTADLKTFDEFRDWLKRSDIGHAPQTWFLLAKVFQERDHRLAERQRAFAERTWGKTPNGVEFVSGANTVADMIDPKKAL